MKPAIKCKSSVVARKYAPKNRRSLCTMISSDGQVKNVPGIYYFKNFLSKSEHDSILATSYQQLDEMKSFIEERKPTGFVSKKHNLTSQESYNNVLVSDESGTRKSCQVFPRYGEDGHVLVYFIGNQSIPHHIHRIVLPKLVDVEPVKKLGHGLSNPVSEFQWRLTVNYYQKPDEKSQVSGFPFHRDIAANGEITTILTLESPALLEFVKPDKVPDGLLEGYNQKNLEPSTLSTQPPVRFLLEPGSLAVLSGEGRWHWLHRVLSGNTFEFGGKTYHRSSRVSVVLGMKNPETN